LFATSSCLSKLSYHPLRTRIWHHFTSNKILFATCEWVSLEFCSCRCRIQMRCVVCVHWCRKRVLREGSSYSVKFPLEAFWRLAPNPFFGFQKSFSYLSVLSLEKERTTQHRYIHTEQKVSFTF
jgi:hypothetical protein